MMTMTMTVTMAAFLVLPALARMRLEARIAN